MVVHYADYYKQLCCKIFVHSTSLDGANSGNGSYLCYLYPAVITKSVFKMSMNPIETSLKHTWTLMTFQRPSSFQLLSIDFRVIMQVLSKSIW